MLGSVQGRNYTRSSLHAVAAVDNQNLEKMSEQEEVPDMHWRCSIHCGLPFRQYREIPGNDGSIPDWHVRNYACYQLD